MMAVLRAWQPLPQGGLTGSCPLAGVTTDMTLDGILSPAELFHPESVGLPDVIFFYR